MTTSRLTWHDTAREPKPKTRGWYLLLTEDGEYRVDRHVPGAQWLTMATIAAWAKLPETADVRDRLGRQVRDDG